MGRLSYTAIMSLNGYIEDESGGFEWAMPDLEVHSFINDLEKSVKTYLFGRRMYEMMAGWQTMGLDPDSPPEEVAFAEVWRAADKIVYSRTLPEVTTPRTQLEREFDPEAVRQLKESTDHEISVSGPDLARHAFVAGLIDDVHVFLVPTLVGGGKPGLPAGIRADLELQNERRFEGGFVYLHYTQR